LSIGPDVIKGISFNIQAAEKIGVVGRTGSGKSTLLLSIFRIMEARAGSITIDGIDISTIGLFQLRSKIGIIPQVRFHLVRPPANTHGRHAAIVF